LSGIDYAKSIQVRLTNAETATRQLVMQAAAELGYARQASAEGLRHISVIFRGQHAVNSELHMQVQNGVHREAQHLERRVYLQWTHAGEQC
jgi:LacI family transcriptional regulator